MTMIEGSCHCGACRFASDEPPPSLTACNCSICRRIAPLWAYSRASTMRLLVPEGASQAYIWGEASLAFHRCKTCGVTVFWQSQTDTQFTVNARLCPPEWLVSLPVRRFDGAQSWQYLDDPDDWSRVGRAIACPATHLSKVRPRNPHSTGRLDVSCYVFLDCLGFALR